MTQLLVTGANGFLGTEIVRRAATTGMQIQATDRNNCRGNPNVDFFPMDIATTDRMRSTFCGANMVVHAAGLAHIFDRSGAMDAALWRVNADGTENVARAAAAAGAQHFVLVSSSAVYGPHEGTVDETAPCRPVGAYAESKLEAETRARAICNQAGMALTILRPVTMFGEGDPGNVKRLVRTVDRRRFIWIGKGTNRKSLLHRDDVAEACMVALRRQPEGELVLNVAGQAYEMREIISTIARELRRTIPPLHLPAAPILTAAALLGRMAPSLAGGRNGLLDSVRKWTQDDVCGGTKIRQLLGWQPQVTLQDGLHREVEWYLKSQRAAS